MIERIALTVVFLALSLRLFACNLQDRQAVAADSYEAQQMRCVEQYADKAHIDHCRAMVKLAWMADSSAPDAGSDGAK